MLKEESQKKIKKLNERVLEYERNKYQGSKEVEGWATELFEQAFLLRQGWLDNHLKSDFRLKACALCVKLFQHFLLGFTEF